MERGVLNTTNNCNILHFPFFFIENNRRPRQYFRRNSRFPTTAAVLSATNSVWLPQALCVLPFIIPAYPSTPAPEPPPQHPLVFSSAARVRLSCCPLVEVQAALVRMPYLCPIPLVNQAS